MTRQEQLGLNRETEDSFPSSLSLRERYDISVNKSGCLSLSDFARSLDLDPHLFKISSKKKLNIKDYVYCFDIELGNALAERSTTQWTIKKRFIDFVVFSKKLNEELIKNARVSKNEVPQLTDFYNARSSREPLIFLEVVEAYLRKLIETRTVRANSVILYEFLEISLLPLANSSHKYKEGYLGKKGGGRFKHNKFKIYCSSVFAHWQERWFILTEEGIMYSLSSSNTHAREMLLFDQTFEIEFGRKATGFETGISVYTPSRRLNLKAENHFEALSWVGEIKKAAKESPYTKVHRYKSFAPIREPIHNCKGYVDGQGYFEELYNSLIKAKREVFIVDWWLSPEIALKRPVEDSESEYRLDKVLGRIANSGVKVYVIVYHEVKMLMYNDSTHTRDALESLSNNITVLRHPSESFFSWSHHEKMVVIDQQVGFIGGLDLCFGRFDTNQHPVNDPNFDAEKGELFQGQDYANLRVADFQNVKEHQNPLIDKASQPRMPFHDAMIKVTGPVVADMSRHFIQFWNHVKVDVYSKRQEVPLPMTNAEPPLDLILEKRENAVMKLRKALKKTFSNKFDANTLSRTLSHHKLEADNKKPGKRVNRYMVSEDRTDSHKTNVSDKDIEENRQNPNTNHGENVPKEESAVQPKINVALVNDKDSKLSDARKNLQKIIPYIKLQLLYAPEEKIEEGTIACQMLRSVAKWSLGLNSKEGNVEDSIKNAYLELIDKAEHFIYIENQFFMSSTAGDTVKNEVAKALISRIERAHANKERFRVLVFLPLVPAFAGEIVDSKSALLKVQMHWQYMTICRGGESIYEVLKEKGITPEDYIQFYSKRSHGKMKDGKPATEMIYIHSKIMIVDDNVLLIGSANINDRSLEGKRESEIAMIFEDSKKVPSRMNGKSVEVREFAHNLRKRLLAEHTGLTEDEVQDPMSEEFTTNLNKITQQNTEIFREIFACYPDDNVRKLDQLEEFSKKQDLSKYDELAPKIKGHIVWFPLQFCADDSLIPPKSTMEHYIPDKTFV